MEQVQLGCDLCWKPSLAPLCTELAVPPLCPRMIYLLQLSIIQNMKGYSRQDSRDMVYHASPILDFKARDKDVQSQTCSKSRLKGNVGKLSGLIKSTEASSSSDE
ncbi:PREDICTED: uncharacterized protein LOC105597089 [Cercocebus atys]|uniref:uncharacterized protein LOC105597089 n=1 Tax=Cercocebus atys TaxID=9531 RepID=UPI0005F4AB98|nr:PREDICTED: uncharacterized protein LOC105597089 [Cercocebus atys]